MYIFHTSLYKKISEVLGLEDNSNVQDEKTSDLADMNILVAEDMDVNWEVISTLLGMYGIKSRRAENGKVALDMLRNIQPAEYDVVFMDIQMPVMNGLEAGRYQNLLFKSAGYKSPLMSHNSEILLMASLIYPFFTKEVMHDKEAIAKLNNLEPEAGEYMRPVLEWLIEFKKLGLMDLEECNRIKDNYSGVIMRFFEGDVPMMLASTDVVSGTKKREALSESFIKTPFKYSFYAVPVLREGSAILEVPSVEFSVNKNSPELEMTNEFMRFILRSEELNNLAKIKRFITCSTVYSFDDVFAPLENTEHLYQLEIGIMDNAYSQLRLAGYKVFTGELSVDEAVHSYGKL